MEFPPTLGSRNKNKILREGFLTFTLPRTSCESLASLLHKPHHQRTREDHRALIIKDSRL